MPSTVLEQTDEMEVANAEWQALECLASLVDLPQGNPDADQTLQFQLGNSKAMRVFELAMNLAEVMGIHDFFKDNPPALEDYRSRLTTLLTSPDLPTMRDLHDLIAICHERARYFWWLYNPDLRTLSPIPGMASRADQADVVGSPFPTSQNTNFAKNLHTLRYGWYRALMTPGFRVAVIYAQAEEIHKRCKLNSTVPTHCVPGTLYYRRKGPARAGPYQLIMTPPQVITLSTPTPYVSETSPTAPVPADSRPSTPDCLAVSVAAPCRGITTTATERTAESLDSEAVAPVSLITLARPETHTTGAPWTGPTIGENKEERPTGKRRSRRPLTEEQKKTRRERMRERKLALAAIVARRQAEERARLDAAHLEEKVCDAHGEEAVADSGAEEDEQEEENSQDRDFTDVPEGSPPSPERPTCDHCLQPLSCNTYGCKGDNQ